MSVRVDLWQEREQSKGEPQGALRFYAIVKPLNGYLVNGFIYPNSLKGLIDTGAFNTIFHYDLWTAIRGWQDKLVRTTTLNIAPLGIVDVPVIKAYFALRGRNGTVAWIEEEIACAPQDPRFKLIIIGTNVLQLGKLVIDMRNGTNYIEFPDQIGQRPL